MAGSEVDESPTTTRPTRPSRKAAIATTKALQLGAQAGTEARAEVKSRSRSRVSIDPTPASPASVTSSTARTGQRNARDSKTREGSRSVVGDGDLLEGGDGNESGDPDEVAGFSSDDDDEEEGDEDDIDEEDDESENTDGDEYIDNENQRSKVRGKVGTGRKSNWNQSRSTKTQVRSQQYHVNQRSAHKPSQSQQGYGNSSSSSQLGYPSSTGYVYSTQMPGQSHIGPPSLIAGPSTYYKNRNTSQAVSSFPATSVDMQDVQQFDSNLSTGERSSMQGQEAPQGVRTPREGSSTNAEAGPSRLASGAMTAERVEQDPGGDNPEDDAVFNRLAGLVSNAAAGEDLRLGGGFQEEMAMVDDDQLPEASRRLKKARRPHKVSPEIQRLLGQANMTFITSGPQEAMGVFLDVIRNDPYVHSAWTSLASCYEELGNTDAARQMRFFAAHVDTDEHKWKNLAVEFKEQKETAQCLYCLRKALNVDPKDVECLWELVEIYRSQNDNAKAMNVFKRILKADPNAAHNLALLMELQPLIRTQLQTSFGAQAFRTAFDYHTETFTDPLDPNQFPEPNKLGLEHIVTLVDLLSLEDKLEEAVVVIRRGQRWLQGRRDEIVWDGFDDDREYDPTGYIREDQGNEEEEELEGHALDINLRQRLALLRLKLGKDEEAIIHIDEILTTDVVEFQDFFMQLGNALVARELWEKALECFGIVQECDDIDDTPEMILAIGVCHHMLKSYQEALEAIRWVVDMDKEKRNLDARLKLANLLEDMGQKPEALEIVTEVLRLKASGGHIPTQTEPTKKQMSKADKAASQTLTKRVLEDQMRQKMVALWEDVQEAERGTEMGDLGALDRFIYSAGTMVENHRMARRLFSKDRGVTRVAKDRKGGRKTVDQEALIMQDRLERALGFEEDHDTDDKFITRKITEFYGISAQDWLTLVVKYCCVLMVKNEEDLAMEILDHIMWSALFHSRKMEVALRLTTIACAIRLKAYDKLAENCKRLTQIFQFRPQLLLLLQWSLNGGGEKANTVWQNPPLQKFIQRELHIWDDSARGIRLKYSSILNRWNPDIKVGLSRRLGDYDRLSQAEGEEAMRVDEEEDVPEHVDAVTSEVRGKEDGAGQKRKNGIDNNPKSKNKKGLKSKSKSKSKSKKIDNDEGDQDDEDDEFYFEDDREEDEDDEDAIDGGNEDEGQISTNQDGSTNVIPKPKKFSPNLNVMYGQFMLSTKSFQSALSYEEVPYDPYLCLLIAQAFFGRSMNRQADNRNFEIAQGLAFMTKYRKLSSKDPETQEEVEYNYGRAFHGLGVPHLAVVHYERVLDSVQLRMDSGFNAAEIRSGSMGPQAAHNLILLYAATGSTELVKEKSKWLAI